MHANPRTTTDPTAARQALDLIEAAADLMAVTYDDDTNPEYDRALVELVGGHVGLPLGDIDKGTAALCLSTFGRLLTTARQTDV